MVIDSSGNPWRFTGFYGNPSTFRRIDSWNLLCSLSMIWTGPWFCAGDFNEILSHEDKIGGVLRLFSHMNDFAEAFLNCGFLKILVHGSLMTWSRGKGEDMVMERLDRGG